MPIFAFVLKISGWCGEKESRSLSRSGYGGMWESAKSEFFFSYVQRLLLQR